MSKKTVYFCTMLFDAIAVALAISLGIRKENPLKHFEERGFLTDISVFQLLAISLLSLMVFWILKHRVKSPPQGRINDRPFWRHSFLLWAIVSLGFLFLAIDERYKVHERIDYRIHDILKIQETGITDRIDDLIIALYALFGMAILYLYRQELKNYRQAFSFIKSGLVLLFAMILLDIISNRGDILPLFIKNGSLANTLLIWISVIEDSLKIFAEGYFFVGFYTILDKAKKNNLARIR